MIKREDVAKLKLIESVHSYERFKEDMKSYKTEPCGEETFQARNLYCIRRSQQCLGCRLREYTGFWGKGLSCNQGICKLEYSSREFFVKEGIKLNEVESNRKRDEVILIVMVGGIILFKIEEKYYRGKVLEKTSIMGDFETSLRVGYIDEEDLEDENFGRTRYIGSEEYVGLLSRKKSNRGY